MPQSKQLGNFTQSGMFAGGMSPAQSVPNGVVTPPGTPLVQYQIAYPNAAGQLIGKPEFTYNDTWSAANGIDVGLAITPTITESGTAGYTVLSINPTESSTGSGAKNLQIWAVAGTTRAMLATNGNFGTVGTINAGAASGGLSFLNSVGSYGVGISSTTSALTLTINHSTVLADATTTAFTISLPTASSSLRRVYTIKKIDNTANTVTIQANGAETIDGTNTRVLSTQWSSLQIQSNGTAWYILADR